MDILLFLILSIFVGIMGFLFENKLKKYYTIVYKILWYYLIFSVLYMILFKTTRLEWGADLMIGALFWVSYIVFSIYMSIKSTVVLNGITKPIILLFMMNLMFFFIIEEKKIVSGNVSFSFLHILTESVIILVCQLPIIIITKIVCKKKNTSISNVTKPK